MKKSDIDVLCPCRSLLKKSGCRTPRIELEEIGPSLDLVLRRTHLASDDLYKLAHRQPKALKVKTHNQHVDKQVEWVKSSNGQLYCFEILFTRGFNEMTCPQGGARGQSMWVSFSTKDLVSYQP